MPLGATADPAVTSAQAAFRTTANQKLKRLLAQGVDAGAASSQLLDEIIPQRAPRSPSASHSADVQQLMISTGFCSTQASQTLLLKEEIALLRRQGNNTATVIDKLHKRLRDAGHSGLGSDENEEQGSSSSWRLHGMPQPKKHKISEESDSGMLASPWPPMDVCVRVKEKRHRDDSAQLAQLKKLKLRSGVGD